MLNKDYPQRYKDLERLLIKTPLEPFTLHLFNIITIQQQSSFTIEHLQDLDDDLMKYCLHLSKTLLACLDNEPVKIGTNEVISVVILEALKNAVLKEFKVFMSIAEPSKNFDNISPEMLRREVELLSTYKPKQGRKHKNIRLAWLIIEIRKFYKGHSNKDYRLLFDCFDLFGLIDAEVKKEWEVKDFNAAKTQYIKSIYNQALKEEGLLDAYNTETNESYNTETLKTFKDFQVEQNEHQE